MYSYQRCYRIWNESRECWSNKFFFSLSQILWFRTKKPDLSLFHTLALKAKMPKLPSAPHIGLELSALLRRPVACLGICSKDGRCVLCLQTSGFQMLNMDLRTLVGVSAAGSSSVSSRPSLLMVRFTNGLMFSTPSWMILLFFCNRKSSIFLDDAFI